MSIYEGFTEAVEATQRLKEQALSVKEHELKFQLEQTKLKSEGLAFEAAMRGLNDQGSGGLGGLGALSGMTPPPAAVTPGQPNGPPPAAMQMQGAPAAPPQPMQPPPGASPGLGQNFGQGMQPPQPPGVQGPGLGRMQAPPIDVVLMQKAQQYGIPPDILKAAAAVESGNNPLAVSPKGAQGVMQVMPQTAAQPGMGVQHMNPADLRDPEKNIDFGARYLRRLYEQTGSWPAALQAYNGGLSRVQQGQVPAESRAYAQNVMQRAGQPQHQGERDGHAYTRRHASP